MNISEFETIIQNSVQQLPRRFKRILKKENIQLHARETVPPILQEKFENALIFGVFVGIPYTQRSVFIIQKEPTRIELYKKSFEDANLSPSEMEIQIVKTVIHEIGHYFGFSEKDLKRYNL